jgi:hypothetical protein
MSARDEAAESRRKARASWPIRKLALGQEPPEDLQATTTAEERLIMVEALTAEVWELAGRSATEYTREQTPIMLRPWPPSTPSDDGR